jgi:hypothetical protein
MKIFDEETVIEELKSHQAVDNWIQNARSTAVELNALVSGANFHDVLIKRIEKIEGSDKAIARKKYSKPIVDLFSRLFKKRENVFQSIGGALHLNIESEQIKEQFTKHLESFKGLKSLDNYLSENFFKMLDVDPNGVIFLEYKTEEKEITDVYPTYKSIHDIRNYDAIGQSIKYIVFEPKVEVKDNGVIHKWRVVDSLTDWTILQEGNDFKIDYEKTFKHPFGVVPAVILSSEIEIGKKERLSPVWSIFYRAQDYARDLSILTIYKFQNGFPRSWGYEAECKACRGTGRTGENGICGVCEGSGFLKKKDVTDNIVLRAPKDKEDATIAPNVGGFIQPDIETWTKLDETLASGETSMDKTIWGVEQLKGNIRTATESILDVQPIITALNKYADNVEWVNNFLGNLLAKLVVKTPNSTEKIYHKTYGRRFIIEGTDVLIERYEKGKTAGISTTILNDQLKEIIISKNKNNLIALELELKRVGLEPYLHNDLTTVFNIFGNEEASKKSMFEEFWKTCDHTKTEEVLRVEYNDYFKKEYKPIINTVI